MRLWQAVTRPLPDHPLRQRLGAHAETVGAIEAWNVLAVLVGLASVAIIVVLPTTFPFGVMSLALIYVLFESFVRPLTWAQSAAAVITVERQQNRLDLLAITPPGGDGITRLIYAIFAHADEIVVYIRRIRLIGISATLITGLIVAQLRVPFFEVAAAALVYAVLWGAVLAFYLQSVTLSVLFVSWVSRQVRSAFDARLWVTAGFLGVQTISIVIWLVGAVVSGIVVQRSGLGGWLSYLLIVVILSGGMMAGRAWCVMALTRYLARTGELHPDDLLAIDSVR